MFLAQLEMMVCHPGALRVQFMKAQDLTKSFYILHNLTVESCKTYLYHFQFSEIQAHFLVKNDHLQHPPRSPSPFVPSVQISRNGSGAAGGDPRDPQLHWQRRPSNVGSTMLTRFIHNPVGSRGDIPLRLWNLHYLLQYNVTCISVGNDYHHLLVIPTQAAQHSVAVAFAMCCSGPRGGGSFMRELRIILKKNSTTSYCTDWQQGS